MNPSLLDYLRALYPEGTPGELLAYTKTPRFNRRFGVAANIDGFARQIRHLDSQADVYLTINTLDGAAVRRRGPFARGLETEVAAVVALDGERRRRRQARSRLPDPTPDCRRAGSNAPTPVDHHHQRPARRRVTRLLAVGRALHHPRRRGPGTDQASFAGVATAAESEVGPA